MSVTPYYLESLSDEELLQIIRHIDFGFWLDIIKGNRKHYMQYDARLGRKDKRSPLVQKNLPGIVLELYRKRDQNFLRAVDQVCIDMSKNFIDIIRDELHYDLNTKDIKDFTTEEIAQTIVDYDKLREDEVNNKLDIELFWVQLKMVGYILTDEIKKEILDYAGKSVIEEKLLDEVAPAEEETTQEKPKVAVKPKARKLTAQEKADKTRAAEKAKAEALAKEHDTEEQPLTVEITIDKELETKPNVENVEKKEIEKVSQYIGTVNIKGSFYNFTPIGKYEDGVYTALSEKDIDRLFPLSQKHNINLYYSIWDQEHVKFVQEHFYENQVVAMNCEADDLEVNRTSDGSINQTGYKTAAIDAFKNGKIQFLSEIGLYPMIKKDALLDDICTKKIARINTDELEVVEGVKYLINLGDSFVAGPLPVKYSATSNSYYFQMQTNENRRFVTGYSNADCKRVNIETSLDDWIPYFSESFYSIDNEANSFSKDYISDQELLEALKDTLSKTKDLDYSNLDVEGILEKLDNSIINGPSLPEGISQGRIQRIKEILSSEEELQSIYKEFSDLIYDLLLKNKNNEQTEELFTAIVEKHPDLIDKMPGLKLVQTKVEKLKQNLEELEAQKIEATAEIKSIQEDASKEKRNVELSSYIDEEISSKKAELDSILKRLSVASEGQELLDKKNQLTDEVKYFESRRAQLLEGTRDLEGKFIELVNRHSERMAEITFDGFMSSKMLEAAAGWEAKEELDKLNSLVNKLNTTNIEGMGKTELVDYIVDTVRIARPGYSKNVVLNIVICAMQGFLTVFSGIPGCGKTSICNILSNVLGLNDYSQYDSSLKGISRYVPVSVERGWTSKRDFIGYYNPLTKSFEESNREVFDGLRMLDAESRQGIRRLPFVILLDEANLSPMEYYWADFMNVCDDLKDNSGINLGNDNVFKVPETLHFLATINNDHTTDILSPRLIDRAWIIVLPRITNFSMGSEISKEKLRNVLWEDLYNVFVAPGLGNPVFDREIQLIYDGIKEKLGKQDIYISPRVDIAIHKYWGVASEVMEQDEYENQPNVIALDYAIAQKVLPRLSGNGEEYELWLNDLKTYFDDKSLDYSSELLGSMIDRGSRLKYFQFFN